MPFAWMNLELTSAWPLAALPLLLALLAYGFAHSLVDFPRWQRVASLVCRSGLVLLLMLALAGLAWIEPGRDQFVVFVVDHSRSIDAKARARAEAFVENALPYRRRDRVAFLHFAAQPGPVQAEFGDPPANLDRDATNLAAALEAAAGAVPPSYVPHLVLLSDGNETEGGAVQSAARAGVAVSTVPLPSREEPDVQVSLVDVPAQVREGESFHVEVVLDSNHDDEGVLELFANGVRVAEKRDCKVKKGPNPFRIQQSAPAEKVAVYTAKISGFRHNALLDNDSNVGITYTAGQPRVLVIDRDKAQAYPLRDALVEQGIQVDIRPPRAMPDTLVDLQAYEMLILSDVAANELTRGQMEVARSFVKDLGGGLLMLGGDNAYGLGGYYKTVLEDVLPVRCDFSKEKETKPMAMVLVIDKSGSMAGEKMQMAKDAAKNAVELLGPRDQIGVIGFDARFTWVSKLQSSANKSAILEQINRLDAHGGTRLFPPMNAAYQALRSANAQVKHVVLLTDGEVESADYLGLAGRMWQENITVSTVAVGPEADQGLLRQIAEAGRGRFYFAQDPSSVPQIFARETMTAGKSAIQEDPITPVVLIRTGVLANLNFADAPLLHGHVRTRAKPASEVVLAADNATHDPLLVWWRAGLGVGVAFTSDAKNRWASEWVGGWRSGYSRFWAQTVRYAMRKSDARAAEVKVQSRGRKGLVTLDAFDSAGRFLNQSSAELTVLDPRERASAPAMKQTAPGRYSASFDTPERGVYHLMLKLQQLGKVHFQTSRALAIGYPDELRLRPTNEKLLRDLAALTGGRYDPAPEEIFAPPERAVSRPLPLWPYLVMAAALLFVLDVALRRVDAGELAARLRRLRFAFARRSR
jgi:Mg-chelatase subunit ChlD